MRRERVLTGLIVIGTLAGLSCGGGGKASAPAAAKPSAAPAKPVKLVAVVGADGHGKSTLLSAVARTLAEPPDGRRRSYEELKLGNGYTVSFDAGDRTVTLREYPSHAETVAALADPKAGLAGLLLVVEQPAAIAKQTREQIQAAGRGGVRALAVAQTKDDLVDDVELKDLEQGEIEQALVEAKLLEEKAAGTWEGGKFKPGSGLTSVRVSARRVLEGDAKAREAVARLIAEIEKGTR